MRASGVTLLIPLGLVLGIGATATLGGGVSGLGQVVAGPSIPNAAERQFDVETGSGSGPILPAIPASARDARETRRSEPRASGDGSAPPPRRSAPRDSAPERRPDRPREPRPPQTPDRPTTPTTPGPGGPAETAPASTPPEPDNPVRQLGDAVTGTVEQIPVVGPPVAGVVQTIVDLLAPPR